jgi:membrane protease YdiL (CAAX protease family)
MNPGLLDHGFVIVVLGLIFPLGGWWAYRRFLLRLARDGGAALVREYRITLLWLLALGLGTLAIWLAAGRAPAALGFATLALRPDQGFVPGIAGGALGGLALRPILAAVSGKVAASFRRQFGSLEAFLPRTGEQLAWGLVVSVFAGVFEEVAYRGYLIAYFSVWLSDWGALAASSLLFGFAHFYQGKLGLLTTTALGAAFGWLYLETGSLLLPMLLHAAVDVSAMVTAWIVLRDTARG